MALLFDPIAKVITVESPDVEVTCQNLLNAIREWEDDLVNLDERKVADASGKQALGGGTLVGITLTLLDWKLAFEARSGPGYTLCDISGGNLVRYNSMTQDFDSPVEPTAFVTISKTSSASATVSDLEALQAATFGGFVSVDVTSSNTGTEFPKGTPEFPVNSLADACLIGINRGLLKFQIIGDYTTNGTEVLDNLSIHGQNDNATRFTVTSGTSCDQTNFRDLTLTGEIVDEIDFRRGILEEITGGMWGRFHQLLFKQFTFKLGDGFAYFTDCWTGVIGPLNPIFDYNNSECHLAFRNYAGPLRFQNKTSAEGLCLDLNSSRITFDASCTTGGAAIRGIAYVIDNSTGTFSINTDGMISLVGISEEVSALKLPHFIGLENR